ncbi:LuxR C-terminal-related transcriptional regulator [Acinetobacter baumannii]|uniref:LuxR C-terminal-related transcriptional regulator n=1 Tax=Acinetobacter baumannii TaxID=470 RepID=UPI002957CCD2|nr:LuxR C-terminal-related transcriptional regulator [Acinetobacter baumannii]MDV7609579.1 LuxR C-terminal-related transcriptional regulator [Acinetobacter baumannii]MDV7611370.1 LuxR C-terminal-related transcriptional regulator [Acinetobacter baumannii]MDV7615565.1 LuxR C-terminal-related transcriptional regulator [Acinetobacter baumannii]
MEHQLSHHDGSQLFLTKLQCPPLQHQQVIRERLLNKLTHPAADQAKLILIHAPAGYGKSVLLAQYFYYSQKQNIQTLWITLDLADNDLDRLVRHLHASWSSLEPELILSEQVISQGLLQRFSNSTRPFILFFDEFEVIHNPVVLHYIQQLIEYLPKHSKIVIGSRHVPDLGIGRLRLRNQLIELKQNDLCFSFQETYDLLHQQHTLAIKGRDIQVLIHRTEGWIAAIHLAILALNNSCDASHFFATFSGSHAELAQLLAEDILRKLDVSHRNFLLQTSILNELNVELCNQITQQQDSEQQLCFLVKNNLFLIPLDTTSTRYRYHGLFSSYLLDRLKATQPELFIELNHRAAEWYLQQNRPLTAIDHLLHNPNQSEAIKLIDQQAMSLLTEGRVRRLLRWYDLLLPKLLQQRPALKLIFGWALLLNRRYQDAQAILNEFLSPANSHLPTELIQQAHTLQCLQLALSDQINACYQKSEQQLTQVDPKQVLQYGVLITIVAYCLIAVGKYEDARQTMAKALLQDLGLQTTFIRSLCDALEGWIDLIQGQIKHASPRLERSYERVWLSDKKGILGGKAVIGIPYAELLYERNELQRAQYILSECLVYARENGTVDSLISAYLIQSRISRLLNDEESSQRYLQELEEVGLEHGLIRVIASVKLEQTRIFWLENNLAQAQITLNQFLTLKKQETEVIYTLPAHDIESGDIMIWRMMIATGQAEQAKNEIKLAMKLAQTAQRYRHLLKLRILLSTALLTTGKINSAMRTLSEALKLAQQEGFVRIFLDEGKSIEPLFQQWLKKTNPTVNKMDIAAILRQPFITPPMDETTVITIPCEEIIPTSDLLTKREKQVLQYLAKGARTTAIAEALFVSEVTIKAHLRNINSKLGAHGRVEAVAFARERGLLP